jgi:hypothetical protein
VTQGRKVKQGKEEGSEANLHHEAELIHDVISIEFLPESAASVRVGIKVGTALRAGGGRVRMGTGGVEVVPGRPFGLRVYKGLYDIRREPAPLQALLRHVNHLRRLGGEVVEDVVEVVLGQHFAVAVGLCLDRGGPLEVVTQQGNFAKKGPFLHDGKHLFLVLPHRDGHPPNEEEHFPSHVAAANDVVVREVQPSLKAHHNGHDELFPCILEQLHLRNHVPVGGDADLVLEVVRQLEEPGVALLVQAFDVEGVLQVIDDTVLHFDGEFPKVLRLRDLVEEVAPFDALLHRVPEKKRCRINK